MTRLSTYLTVGLLTVSFALVTPFHVWQSHALPTAIVDSGPANAAVNEPHAHPHSHTHGHTHHHEPMEDSGSGAEGVDAQETPLDEEDHHGHTHGVSDHSVYTKTKTVDFEVLFATVAVSWVRESCQTPPTFEFPPESAPPPRLALPSLPALRAPPALS